MPSRGARRRDARDPRTGCRSHGRRADFGAKLMVAGNGGAVLPMRSIWWRRVRLPPRRRPRRNARRRSHHWTLPSSPLSRTTMASSASLRARLKLSANQRRCLPGHFHCSGNSPNILRAYSEQCRATGIVTIGLTGSAGGKMLPLCDYCLRIPTEVTMYIQQAHLALEHIFSLLVERRYFAAKPAAKG